MSLCKEFKIQHSVSLTTTRRHTQNKDLHSLWIQGSLWNVKTRRSDGVLWQQAVGVIPTHVRHGRRWPVGFRSQEGTTAVGWKISIRAILGVTCSDWRWGFEWDLGSGDIVGRRWWRGDRSDGRGSGYRSVICLGGLWFLLFYLLRRIGYNLGLRLFHIKNLLWDWGRD